MKPPIGSFPVRQAWGFGLLILFTGAAAGAPKLSIPTSDSSKELALARYMASHAERDAVANSGPVGVLIQASLPKLYKEAALIGVRAPGENSGRTFQVLEVAGDDTVVAEVIQRYLASREQIDLPLSSGKVTRSDYNLHYAGEVKAGGALAYVYEISPKKKRHGMVSGQLWIDSGTGQELMLSAQIDLTDTGGRVDVVRDTKVINGSDCGRITHVTFEIPLLGRAEVSITEVPLTATILLPESE